MNSQDGQATIEAALTLPVVLIALLLIVQVGVVVRDAIALAQVAREASRAVAVSGHEADATDAVTRSAGPLDASRIDAEVSPSDGGRKRGDEVTVALAYTERLSIPVVSRFLTLDLPLHASSVTRAETDTATPSPGP